MDWRNNGDTKIWLRMRLADYVIKTALSWMTLLVEQMSNMKKANVDPVKGNTKENTGNLKPIIKLHNQQVPKYSFLLGGLPVPPPITYLPVRDHNCIFQHQQKTSVTHVSQTGRYIVVSSQVKHIERIACPHTVTPIAVT